MEIIIITGMSGAGKSRVIDTMEDIGYYCVDNVPAKLIRNFAELARQSEGNISRMAIVVDVRGGSLFRDLGRELDRMNEEKIPYRLLFLDCDNETLLRRYKETRRKHPLYDANTPSLEDAIEKERDLLSEARQRAHYIIDTTHLAPIQLKEKISNIFLDNVANGMLINCMSFGFKYGYPSEADLVFDVRCLPNPFYIPDLKYKTGIDHEVSDYVMEWPQSQELFAKLSDLIDFLIPLYISEGKSQLVIAMGCTGGKHRSVTFAEKMYRHLLEKDMRVTVNHRDISK
ncbi:MAG: RNase adapter RapZ [Massiliimalia sp.]